MNMQLVARFGDGWKWLKVVLNDGVNISDVRLSGSAIRSYFVHIAR